MNNIYYTSLFNLINDNIDKLTIIKSKYINLLSMLTSVSDLNDNQFHQLLSKINQNSLIWIACINEVTSSEFDIIASGTLLIEQKFIRGGMNVGHIEDIVVHNNNRKKGISQVILDKLKEFAKNNNCYKIILDCKESVSHVYIKNKFEINGLQMSYYF